MMVFSVCTNCVHYNERDRAALQDIKLLHKSLVDETVEDGLEKIAEIKSLTRNSYQTQIDATYDMMKKVKKADGNILVSDFKFNPTDPNKPTEELINASDSSNSEKYPRTGTTYHARGAIYRCISKKCQGYLGLNNIEKFKESLSGIKLVSLSEYQTISQKCTQMEKVNTNVKASTLFIERKDAITELKIEAKRQGANVVVSNLKITDGEMSGGLLPMS